MAKIIRINPYAIARGTILPRQKGLYEVTALNLMVPASHRGIDHYQKWMVRSLAIFREPCEFLASYTPLQSQLYRSGFPIQYIAHFGRAGEGQHPREIIDNNILMSHIYDIAVVKLHFREDRWKGQFA